MGGQPLARTMSRWLADGGSLRARALRGGVWLLLGDAAAKAGGLLKVAVLGRLLSPVDFGLIGIATIVLKGLEQVSEPGFTAALIQRPGDIRPFLDTVWTTQIVRSLVLAAAVVAGAPLAGWFFDAPDAVAVVRSAAVVLVLRGFTNPAVVHLRKDLEFRRQVVWRSTGMLAGLLVGIPAALAWRNVWALVASVIAAQAADTALSYWAVPYRPRLRFDLRGARTLMAYGKWVFWANVAAFVGLQADSIAVGKMLDTTALGFYQMAYGLAMIPTLAISTQVRGVLFPAFSKMAGVEAHRRAFLAAMRPVAALILPVACVLTAFGEPMIQVVLGNRWLAVVPAFQLLVWAGAGSAFSALTSALFEARGRPDLVFKLALVQIAAWALTFPALVQAYGIAGMAGAVTIGVNAMVLAKMAVAARMVHASPGQLAVALAAGVAGSVPAVLVAAAVPVSLATAVTAGALAAVVSGGVLLKLPR